jgi:predicted DNA-binding transcriptional regulator YafY
VRADRLLAELLLLQTRGPMSAARLAAELEVSERTIYRDMEALSAAGVPVYTERGRHGGCALLPGYSADVSGLTESEARALFMFTGRGAPPGTEADLRQALRKLLSALPAQQRPAAEAARERLVVDPRGWHQPNEEVPHLTTVQEAVWSTRRLRLRYRSSDDQRPRAVTVDPYGLLVKSGRWYLIAAAAGAPRIYRVSRVDGAELLDAPAHRPPGLDLEELWQQLRGELEDRGPGLAVRLRVRAEAAARLVRLSGRQLAEPAPDPLPPPNRAGLVTLDLRYVALGAARAVLAGFGGDVEVLRPTALRRAMVGLAEEILARYGRPAG